MTGSQPTVRAGLQAGDRPLERPAPAPPLRRVVRSFRFALAGLGKLVRTQPNFAVHLVLGALAAALAVALRLPPAELAIVALTIAVVLAAEAFNSAVEALSDMVSPGYHPLVEHAKDVSAGAVLLAAIGAAAVALALFGPRLLALATSR